MRPVPVVMADALGKHVFEVVAAGDQGSSRHSDLAVLAVRSANALALGERTGVLMTSMLSEVNTSSKEASSFASRSRNRKRNDRPRSARSPTRVRATRVTKAAVGCPITPRMCTARLWISMTNSTYSSRNATVATVNTSVAKMRLAWERRNSAQGRATPRCRPEPVCGAGCDG